MSTRRVASTWNSALSIVLGLVAVLFVFAIYTDRPVPLITDMRAAFIALVVLGFVMCAVSMGKIAAGLGWSHPATIGGMILGAAIVLLVIAMLAGWQVPLIPDYWTAFKAVAVLGLGKWALGWVARLFI